MAARPNLLGSQAKNSSSFLKGCKRKKRCLRPFGPQTLKYLPFDPLWKGCDDS